MFHVKRVTSGHLSSSGSPESAAETVTAGNSAAVWALKGAQRTVESPKPAQIGPLAMPLKRAGRYMRDVGSAVGASASRHLTLLHCDAQVQRLPTEGPPRRSDQMSPMPTSYSLGVNTKLREGSSSTEWPLRGAVLAWWREGPHAEEVTVAPRSEIAEPRRRRHCRDSERHRAANDRPRNRDVGRGEPDFLHRPHVVAIAACDGGGVAKPASVGWGSRGVSSPRCARRPTRSTERCHARGRAGVGGGQISDLGQRSFGSGVRNGRRADGSATTGKRQ